GGAQVSGRRGGREAGVAAARSPPPRFSGRRGRRGAGGPSSIRGDAARPRPAGRAGGRRHPGGVVGTEPFGHGKGELPAAKIGREAAAGVAPGTPEARRTLRARRRPPLWPLRPPARSRRPPYRGTFLPPRD